MTYDILYWFSVLSYLFVPVFGLFEMLIDRKYQKTTSKVAKLKWELYRVDKVRVVNYPTGVVFGYKIPKVFTKNTSEKPEVDWEMIKQPAWLLIVAPVITIMGIFAITIAVLKKEDTFSGLIGTFFKLYYDKLEKLEWSKELLDELESEKKERVNARQFIYGEQYPEFEMEVV